MLLLLAIAKTALFAEPPPENPYASPSVEIDPEEGRTIQNLYRSHRTYRLLTKIALGFSAIAVPTEMYVSSNTAMLDRLHSISPSAPPLLIIAPLFSSFLSLAAVFKRLEVEDQIEKRLSLWSVDDYNSSERSLRLRLEKVSPGCAKILKELAARAAE